MENNLKVTTQIVMNQKKLDKYRVEMKKILKGSADYEEERFIKAANKYIEICLSKEEFVEILFEARKYFGFEVKSTKDVGKVDKELNKLFIRYAKSRTGVPEPLNKYFDKIIWRIERYFKNEKDARKLSSEIFANEHLPRESTKKLKLFFRWFAVFPGAILAGLLVTFPLHWLLALAFASNGRLLGFIELPSGANTSIEYMIYPSIIALTYIYTGYKIAPKHKVKTAAALFGIYIFLSLTLVIISLFGGSVYGINIEFSWRVIIAMIGAIVGLFLAITENKK